MSEYSIALIREDQIEETKALMSRCFDAKYASIFYLYPESTLVVTSNTRVVAGINLDVYQVNKKVRMGYIGWLYTDNEARGNGLAGKLLKEAIRFLTEQGCTSLSACVEGDNPASFKQLAKEGFSILGLRQQLKLFKMGTVKVYHHASRFFDMGYFLWHKSLSGQTTKAANTGIQPLILTLLGNTLLFYFCLKGWNLLSLAGLHPIKATFPSLIPPQQLMAILTPSLLLLARTGAMALIATIQKKRGENKRKVRGDKPVQGSMEQRVMVYRGWDTAWISALLLTFTVGLPFPVPGNLYIKGSTWNLTREKELLAAMGIASQVGVGLACLLVPKGLALLFGLTLLFLDGFFFFYPFCGFNASRIQRMGAKTYGLSVAITLAVVVLLLVY